MYACSKRALNSILNIFLKTPDELSNGSASKSITKYACMQITFSARRVDLERHDETGRGEALIAEGYRLCETQMCEVLLRDEDASFQS
jgi:hypothetical protein